MVGNFEEKPALTLVRIGKLGTKVSQSADPHPLPLNIQILVFHPGALMGIGEGVFILLSSLVVVVYILVGAKLERS